MKNLVIVESPSKAKTIKKFLGKDYDVIASKGHVRDLPKSRLGVDIENGFEPEYINMKGKGPVIKELKTHAKKCDKVYLATDPDREGEAISWHLSKILNLDPDSDDRVEFTEITKSGIKKGMSNPHKINMDLVEAQAARRILDRIVGYKLSPILWKQVRRGLSAGRVQSVCVKLIVDREREIQKFVPEEYHTIDAVLKKQGEDEKFSASLFKLDGKKIEKNIKTSEDAKKILDDLKKSDFSVSDVTQKLVAKHPAPPFTTSTMQQAAAGKLGFQARKTMMIAQELYEGVEIAGMGSTGLITYMRTDSLRVSNEARNAATDYIRNNYGDDFIPPKPRIYKSGKNSQDAHEAIRPSMPGLEPDKIKSSLTLDQYKLYNLIWSRFIASQMADAKFYSMAVSIKAGNAEFRANGNKLVFKGYLRVYVPDGSDMKDSILPALEKGDALEVDKIEDNKHFTQAPPRYTESSLIKTLESDGIGRPSTYAPIITTITSRGYVERNQKQLVPTELGFTTTELMEENFKDIVDTGFTANMEDGLDKIEEGKENRTEYLEKFWDVFSQSLEKAEENMKDKSYKIPDEETDIICEKCGRKMVIKTGRYGKFLACSGFPECKNSKPLVKDTGAKCPKCGKRIIQKKSKRGRTFYGCEGYPECDFATWNEPTEEKCPNCGNNLFKKGIKKITLVCENPGCGYERKENDDDK